MFDFLHRFSKNSKVHEVTLYFVIKNVTQAQDVLGRLLLRSSKRIAQLFEDNYPVKVKINHHVQDKSFVLGQVDNDSCGGCVLMFKEEWYVSFFKLKDKGIEWTFHAQKDCQHESFLSLEHGADLVMFLYENLRKAPRFETLDNTTC